METIGSLLQYCKQDGRVCPQPTHWHRLWLLLPNRKRVGVSWVPALPMILAGWSAPDAVKVERLTEHIEWAERHGALLVVADFLRKLREEDWHHVGE